MGKSAKPKRSSKPIIRLNFRGDIEKSWNACRIYINGDAPVFKKTGARQVGAMISIDRAFVNARVDRRCVAELIRAFPAKPVAVRTRLLSKYEICKLKSESQKFEMWVRHRELSRLPKFAATT